MLNSTPRALSLFALSLSAMATPTALRSVTPPSVGRHDSSRTKHKPWGGSVKRHARAMAKARRAR